MLPGFNTNITYKNTKYHIQTEDGGVKNPVIVTFLYSEGEIIASKKTSYAHLTGEADYRERVKKFMSDQHRSVIKNLLAGEYSEGKKPRGMEETVTVREPSRTESRDITFLIEKAKQVRIEILKMLTEAGSGHTGGSLSACDIVTALYFSKMRHKPYNPTWRERDRFILSKGHAAPLLYAALALTGYFDSAILKTLRKIGSPLQGHPCSRTLPGVEISTGSLGQGLSVSNGIALGLKMDNLNSRVYCLLGDGEIQEGQVWEAAMTAAHYKLDNLCAIVDLNGLQIDGPVERVKAIEPVASKWSAFGWHVIEIDGHDIEAILNALDEAETIKSKPAVIIAHTIKGKGVSFFEGKVEYHGIAPTREELEKALRELEGDG